MKLNAFDFKAVNKIVTINYLDPNQASGLPKYDAVFKRKALKLKKHHKQGNISYEYRSRITDFL
jgi:hypothetical protein